MSTWLGATLTVAALGLSTTSAAQIDDTFDALEQTQVLIRSGRPERNLDREVVAAFGELPGVVNATALGRISKSPQGQLITTVDGDGPSVGLSVGDRYFSETLGLADWSGRELDAGFHNRGDAVAVVGAVAARELGLSPPYEMQSIFVFGNPVSIVGVFGSSPRRPSMISEVIVPYSWAQIADLEPEVELIVVQTGIGSAQTIADRSAVLADPFRPDSVLVAAPPTVSELREAVSSEVDLLVAFMAIGSMAAGSIGIAHVSFVSVLRRQGEFSLRQALGMTPRDLFLLVVFEGGLLGLAAGFNGVVVGTTVVVVVSYFQNWTPLLETTWLLGVAVASTLLGSVMSAYPAHMASKVAPAKGLRDL